MPNNRQIKLVGKAVIAAALMSIASTADLSAKNGRIVRIDGKTVQLSKGVTYVRSSRSFTCEDGDVWMARNFARATAGVDIFAHCEAERYEFEGADGGGGRGGGRGGGGGNGGRR